MSVLDLNQLPGCFRIPLGFYVKHKAAAFHIGRSLPNERQNLIRESAGPGGTYRFIPKHEMYLETTLQRYDSVLSCLRPGQIQAQAQQG